MNTRSTATCGLLLHFVGRLYCPIPCYRRWARALLVRMFSLVLLALAVGSVAPPCPQGFTRATSVTHKFVVLSDAQRKEALGGYTPFSVPRKALPLLAAAGLPARQVRRVDVHGR